MKVYALDTLVEIRGEIEGWITAVCIRDQGVCYEVRWWDGADIKEQWFSPREITPRDSRRPITIGFNL